MKRSKSNIALTLLEKPEDVTLDEKEELLSFIRTNYWVSFRLQDLGEHKDEILEFLRRNHEEYVCYLKDIMIR